MTTSDTLREFIAREVRWDRPAAELTDDFPLIESNLVDSLGIFHIVGFVEEQFGVRILDEELVPANFGTIGGIARLVDAKRANA